VFIDKNLVFNKQIWYLTKITTGEWQTFEAKAHF